jgi:putative ABC transport system permease protein
VEACAVTSWIGQFGNYDEPFVITPSSEGEPEIVYSYTESVSPDYFRTFGIEPVAGRAFNEEDQREARQVVVVNEAYVQSFLREKDPVGQTISLVAKKAEDQKASSSSNWEIIGVVPEVRVSNFTHVDRPEPIVYFPFTETSSMFMSLVVHTGDEDTGEIQEAIEETILKLDPNLPVYFVQTMDEYIDSLIYPYRMSANFFLMIGFMALFLAAIGVYGMLAFNVSRRRREIGIRMALGADTLRIVTQMLRQGFVQVALGLVVGTGLAYLVGMMARDFLLGTSPTDPSVYAGVLLTLIGVATLAFFIPARRAARLSPMEALRYE